MYSIMKKTYIKPENTVVRIATEQFIAESLNKRIATENGEDGEAREVLISEETTIIARSAWQSW